MNDELEALRNLAREIDGWLKAQRLGRGIRCMALAHIVEVRLK